MKAKSIKGKTPGEIKNALQQSMADGYQPTLAIVFLSVKQDKEAVSKLLDDYGIQIFGATTAGEFIDGEIEEGSIVMLLLDMNPSYFKIEFLETSQDTSFEDAIKLGMAGRETFTNPAFIIANSGVSSDGEPFVEGILQGFGKTSSPEDGEVTIFGGKAGDDLALEATFVFTNGKSSDSALVALIIDEDKIDVKGIATCGWQAIGTTKTVTKSEGSIVYTLDDKPALDMLLNYLGVELKLDGDNEIVTFLSSWYYPLQVERENVDPAIRTAMFANREDRSLIFMFSCVSRYLSFGMVITEEIEQVQNIWNAPMAGFFSYGEYGKSLSAVRAGKTGKNDYHNNTCCVVAQKEK